jgi:hypothetical protein
MAMAEAAAKKADVGVINSDVGIITPTTPLRLETAARLAFPDGSMKLAGLRREIARGRLAYEVIANKHYTTLADIEAMRELCRVKATDHGSTSVLPDERAANSNRQCGSSETNRKSSPQDLLREQLKLHRQQRRSSS